MKARCHGKSLYPLPRAELAGFFGSGDLIRNRERLRSLKHVAVVVHATRDFVSLWKRVDMNSKCLPGIPRACSVVVSNESPAESAVFKKPIKIERPTFR